MCYHLKRCDCCLTLISVWSRQDINLKVGVVNVRFR